MSWIYRHIVHMVHIIYMFICIFVLYIRVGEFFSIKSHLRKMFYGSFWITLGLKSISSQLFFSQSLALRDYKKLFVRFWDIRMKFIYFYSMYFNIELIICWNRPGRITIAYHISPLQPIIEIFFYYFPVYCFQIISYEHKHIFEELSSNIYLTMVQTKTGRL